MVAFGFLPKILEGVQMLSFYDCRLSGGDTQALPAVIKKI